MKIEKYLSGTLSLLGTIIIGIPIALFYLAGILIMASFIIFLFFAPLAVSIVALMFAYSSQDTGSAIIMSLGGIVLFGAFICHAIELSK